MFSLCVVVHGACVLFEGVQVWCVLTGHSVPYPSVAQHLITQGVGDGSMVPDVSRVRLQEQLDIQSRLRQILKQCFQYDPSSRPLAQELHQSLNAIHNQFLLL